MDVGSQRAVGGDVRFGVHKLSPRHHANFNSSSRSMAAPTISESSVKGSERQSFIPEPRTLPKENIGTSVRNTISPNVTPRSGSRKARLDTASPTSSAAQRAHRRSSTQSDARPHDTPTPAQIGLLGNNEDLQKFKVGDGNSIDNKTRLPLNLEPRTSQHDHSVQPVAGHFSTASFFYADEVQRGSDIKESPSLPGRNSPQSSDRNGRIFYADNARALKLSESPEAKPLFEPRMIPSVYSPVATSQPPRATSPLREEIRLQKPAPHRIAVKHHSRGLSDASSNHNTNPAASMRKSSNSISARISTASRLRSPSLRSAGSEPSESTKRDLSERWVDRDIKSPNLIGGTPSAFTAPSGPSNQKCMSTLTPSTEQSPAQPQSKIEQANELAASARRDRKVLDLEISNSSLLAINRTLEREMRKQTTELRRLRRLTRFGRTSIPSTRSTSGKFSSPEGLGLDIDGDNPPFDSESEDEKADDSHSARSSTMATSLCSSPTDRAANIRFQDLKRPPLDLDGQRTLFLDGQKLNQSITRCLTATNSLLAAGREALEHRYAADEIDHLSAKVLSPEEHEEDCYLELGKTLLSPSIPSNPALNPFESSMNDTRNLEDSPSLSAQSAQSMEEPQLVLDDTSRLDSTMETSSETFNLEPAETLGLATSLEPGIPPDELDRSEDLDHSDQFEASLDGLDEDSDSQSHRGLQTNTEAEDLRLDKISTRTITPPQSPRLRQGSPVRSAVAAANAPGNRSSMQALGSVFGLGSLSLFGLSGVNQQGGS